MQELRYKEPLHKSLLFVVDRQPPLEYVGHVDFLTVLLQGIEAESHRCPKLDAEQLAPRGLHASLVRWPLTQPSTHVVIPLQHGVGFCNVEPIEFSHGVPPLVASRWVGCPGSAPHTPPACSPTFRLPRRGRGRSRENTLETCDRCWNSAYKPPHCPRTDVSHRPSRRRRRGKCRSDTVRTTGEPRSNAPHAENRTNKPDRCVRRHALGCHPANRRSHQ